MLLCQRRSELFSCIQTNKTHRIPSDFPKQRLNNGPSEGLESAFIVGERRRRPPFAPQSNSFDWNQHNKRGLRALKSQMAAFFSPFFNSLSVHHSTAAAAGQRNATLAGMLLRWRLNLGRAGSKGQAWLEIQWAPSLEYSRMDSSLNAPPLRLMHTPLRYSQTSRVHIYACVIKRKYDSIQIFTRSSWPE